MLFNKISVIVAGFAIIGGAYGHANIQPKDNSDEFNGRSYEEGTSAYIDLVLSHGCRSEKGNLPTRSVTIVFPNATDLSGVAYSKGDNEERYAGNALMGVKPLMNNNWKKIHLKTGQVPEFYNHGSKVSDVRSIHWLGGNVPDEMYEKLAFRAKLPYLGECTESLRVYTPVVQYCGRGHYAAWIRSATPSFPEDTVSVDYAPYIDVKRNLEKNPIPESCSEPVTAEAYPSVENIEKYLPLSKHR